MRNRARQKVPPPIRRTSEAENPSVASLPPSIASPDAPQKVHPRLAAARPTRPIERTVGRRTRTEQLPQGATIRTEIPAMPLRRMAEIALTASIYAAALRQQRRELGAPLRLDARDLRRKVRAARIPNLILFVVDGSGSMAARQRMSAVKGAILSLLIEAYQKRDHVGMIIFRGKDAEIVLPPTKSVLMAQRRLKELPTGGRTPLAAGLQAAHDVLMRTLRRDSALVPLLVVVTDGRANVAPPRVTDARVAAYEVAAEIAAQRWSSLVIDCESGYPRLGLAVPLARALQGDCLQLEALSAAQVTKAVRNFARTVQAH